VILLAQPIRDQLLVDAWCESADPCCAHWTAESYQFRNVHGGCAGPGLIPTPDFFSDYLRVCVSRCGCDHRVFMVAWRWGHGLAQRIPSRHRGYILIQLAVAVYAVVLPFAIEAMQGAALNVILCILCFSPDLVIALLIVRNSPLPPGCEEVLLRLSLGVVRSGSRRFGRWRPAVCSNSRPVMGIPTSCGAVALLSVMSASVAFMSRKSTCRSQGRGRHSNRLSGGE